jgi:hypothetical protein
LFTSARVGELLDLVAAAMILPIPELQSPEHEDEDEAHRDEADEGWDANLWRARKPQRPTTEAASSSRKLPMDVESDGDRVVARTRALRKKLAQIVALEARVGDGHVLDRAQLQKVECKIEVEQELATLRPLLVTWGLSRAAKEPMVAGESAALPPAAEEQQQGGDEGSNVESMRYDARLFRPVVAIGKGAAMKGVTTTTTATTTTTTTSTTNTTTNATTTTTAVASPWGGRTAVDSSASPLVEPQLSMGMSPSRNPKLRMGPAPRRAKSSTNLKKDGGKDKDLGKENDAEKEEVVETPRINKPAWGTSSATPASSLLSIQRMESPPIAPTGAPTRRERVSRITANPLAKADDERIFSLADFIPEIPQRCVSKQH